MCYIICYLLLELYALYCMHTLYCIVWILYAIHHLAQKKADTCCCSNCASPQLNRTSKLQHVYFTALGFAHQISLNNEPSWLSQLSYE